MWLPAAENLVLSQDVHIWRAELDQPEWCQTQLAATLSTDEQARAQRFHFDVHRQRFIVGRGILRNILGRYLGKEPGELEFCYSDRGKPSLAGSNSSVCFNLSHSQSLALYAIARRPIGIDLEFIRPLDDALKLAQRFFSPREYAFIAALPPDQKQKAFFQLWTCKEAYLKATGEGLAGLGQVEVSLTPGGAARLIAHNKSQEQNSWFLQPLTPDPNYAAAVAVEGQSQLSCWHFAI
ncbi:4'-phosphopantetheinyl transferase family protein [Microseira wollei]|uniref:4'-phosphopantetheinyl transferase, HetI n=1 Tax=Microseira wollei NIES-4236 TaxID=2530354 RepID=A0AAV3XNB5_9CYAN|nr:4'-phosphopantetheinyl transferase superfamily protein [Microseira wollei]GET42134.1 4'-phosphopantetheinyl transferase, HetI [Microseira wollei NIES-4236]